jgi:chromosome segregation ATPase
MSDVQRELYNLREKATAIANDTTREEKIKKLDSDQKWFRNEAMRLDVETNEYRKKMRNIKVLIQSTGNQFHRLYYASKTSIERERDWLLEKLRSAKEKYRTFKQGVVVMLLQYSFIHTRLLQYGGN